MKLQFTWHSSPAGAQATCTAHDESGPLVTSPIACLLMDDGGLDAKHCLEWLQEGLHRIDAVSSGSNPGPITWGGDAWETTVTAQEAQVYSIDDEHCCDVIPTSILRQALLAWTQFIAEKNLDAVVTIDLAPRAAEPPG
jgi:hypothetical protein